MAAAATPTEVAAAGQLIGVAPHQQAGQWEASCNYDGRELSLGCYPSSTAAARAADLGALGEELRHGAECAKALDEDGLCLDPSPVHEGQHNGYYPAYRQDEATKQRLGQAAAAGGQAVAQLVYQLVGRNQQPAQPPAQVGRPSQQEQQLLALAARTAAMRRCLPGRDAEIGEVVKWAREWLSAPPASQSRDLTRRFRKRLMDERETEQGRRLWAKLRPLVLAAAVQNDWACVHQYLEAEVAEPETAAEVTPGLVA